MAAWLDAYFAGLNPPIDFPLAPAGTPFQLKTWGRLREVPYGTTTTYGQLAGGTSARAVGSAVGRNPISILIPCHRVVGAGGSLIGYAAGIERKQALLELEGVLM
ncbi:MAG: methylated-DNA--[protein]-cysteine S-methyltransferase [Propionibacteriaceae bacterium]|nr:methylated-DNA--[protein]-cysteine S-methyltransferase [Propionibacteriaceae bacterium]